jgi:hypothetical protein
MALIESMVLELVAGCVMGKHGGANRLAVASESGMIYHSIGGSPGDILIIQHCTSICNLYTIYNVQQISLHLTNISTPVDRDGMML